MPDDSSSSSSSSSGLARVGALAKQLLPSSPLFTSSKQDAASDVKPRSQIGTLSLGSTVSLPVYEPYDFARLPDDRLTLSLEDPVSLEAVEWMAKKYALGQHCFLLSPPGPYPRRLALTFAALLRLPVEYVSLTRDVGEAELLQSRNLEKGGKDLSFTDGPVTRAMKNGSLLILEGVERAERNVLPLLNNILENATQDLPDGTILVPESQLASARAEEAAEAKSSVSASASRFQPVSPLFRVVAIGLPVPPYKGQALDPPFRSRFQARWVEGIVPSSLAPAPELKDPEAARRAKELRERWYEWGSLVRLHSVAAHGGEILPPASQLPNVPTTALALIADLASRFPPSGDLPPIPKPGEKTPEQLAEEAEAAANKPKKAVVPPRDGALQVNEAARERIMAREAAEVEKIRKEQAEKPPAESIAPSTRALLSTGYPMLHTLDTARQKIAAELLHVMGLDKGIGTGVEKEPGEDQHGVLGYRIASIERQSESMALLTFEQANTGVRISIPAPCGPLPFKALPPLSGADAKLTSASDTLVTPRLYSILSSMFMLHAAGRDICLLPSSLASSGDGYVDFAVANQRQASSSTSTSIGLFAGMLGYQVENLYVWKDLSGGELIMRRSTSSDGSTNWEPAPLIKGAIGRGSLVHLAGIDVLGSTLGCLGPLLQDRTQELWNGGRAALPGSWLRALEGGDVAQGKITTISPTFRLIATSGTTSQAWLNEETSTLFGFVQPSPMTSDEERQVILSRTGVDERNLETLLQFAARYRALAGANMGLSKSRKLGTRALIRMAGRLAKHPKTTDLYTLVSRNLLIDFMPRTQKDIVRNILNECQIYPRGADVGADSQAQEFLADPVKEANALVFRDQNNPAAEPVVIPVFDAKKKDLDGVSLIPTMKDFYNNNTQTMLLRDLAIDMELGEPLLLMGNQGTGKNKIIDRLAQLLDRPREYVQMHRDSTVAQLLQLTELKDGQIRFLDSPLVRALRLGRLAVIDESDKCSASVISVLKSLGERGELSLPDGRRVRPPGSAGSPDDVIVHPDFRLVLLSNRPGFPFLGNEFISSLGESFSPFAVGNPSLESEVRILRQAAPKVDAKLIRNLDLAFHDLRAAFDEGLITYPLSLRELLHLVRHMNDYPDEPLSSVLLNTMAFDLHRPEVLALVSEKLRKRGIDVDLSLARVKEAAEEKRKEQAGRVKYDAKKEGKDTDLDQPKEGKDDPNNEEHFGGNQWKGGSGGRDTAGVGGRGGFQRVYKGHQVKQISDELKRDVPDHIKEQARKMAAEALAKKLAEEGMTAHEGATYQNYRNELLPQIQHLVNTLNDLQAQAKERTWLVRQQEGELDERRLTNALTGERAVFKRRQEAPPEPGAAQQKPKRIRFLVDVSASMYSYSYDGRLEREIKTVLMIMEAFARIDPGKFVYDIWGHNGESANLPLVKAEKMPQSVGERWTVLRNMNAHMQFCMSGDSTIESLQWACKDLAAKEADDHFVIALSDANMSRYGITPKILEGALKTSEKVKSSIIFLDRGEEGKYLSRLMPGRAYPVQDLKALPAVLSSILTSMMSEDQR